MTTTSTRRLLFALAAILAIASQASIAQEGRAGSIGSNPTDRWNDQSKETTSRTRGVGVGERSYYNDRQRGYFWYEDDPPPPPKETPVDALAQPGQQPQPQEPPPLSVAWLQKKLEETRVRAIDNPTRENVELYVYLQKIAMDKAEKFAVMSQQVAMINPALDESFENPTTTFARKARLQAQESEQGRVLKELASKIGIYYFFKSDCPYCAKQNVTLSALKGDYGFHVMPISTDHRPMPDGLFADWIPDKGQAATLGISATPTLYLFHPPNEVVFLSAGLQTEGQLHKRILQVAEANGWLSRADLEKALRGLPRDFLVDAVRDLGEIDWTDPQQALDALRYASRRGVERAHLDQLGGSQGSQGTPVKPVTPEKNR